MYKLIDTHAHIYLQDFSSDIHEVIKLSRESGIVKIFMPNIDSKSIDSMLQIEQQFNNYCEPMMGLHPCSVNENVRNELNIIESWLEKRAFCAIGEIGIDLYWDKTQIEKQQVAFETQIGWARDLGLPIVIHCRESIDMTIDIVEKYQNGNLRGIFHCFSGNELQAQKIVDLNFLLGIGGIITFKNGGLDSVLPHVDLNNIVLETDSPYLAPVPYRGKRNNPAHLIHIAQRVSEVMLRDISEIAEVTTKNAKIIFQHE